MAPLEDNYALVDGQIYKIMWGAKIGHDYYFLFLFLNKRTYSVPGREETRYLGKVKGVDVIEIFPKFSMK